MGWVIERNSPKLNEKVDMSKQSRSHAPRISVKSSRAQVCHLYSACTSRTKESPKPVTRMDIQKAILNSDLNNLKSAVERAKEAGLSYWELAAATEVLISHDRRVQ